MLAAWYQRSVCLARGSLKVDVQGAVGVTELHDQRIRFIANLNGVALRALQSCRRHGSPTFGGGRSVVADLQEIELNSLKNLFSWYFDRSSMLAKLM